MDKKGYNNLNFPYRGGTNSMDKNHQGATETSRKNKPNFFITL